MKDKESDCFFSRLFLGKRSTPQKVGLGLILILPLLSLLITTWYSYGSISNIKTESQNIIEHIQDNRAELLTAVISENYKQAKMQTECVKYHIVKNLDEVYQNDKEKMKEDYLSKNLDTPFYQIISSNISAKYLNRDNDKNRIFISNRNTILMDNSLTYSKNSLQKWDIIISGSNNEELLRDSLKHIVAQDGQIVFWVDDKSIDHVKFTIDDVHKPIHQFIYDQIKSGTVQDLYNYSIITASYIFDHEDIFGVPDVSAGKFTDNDKLYIIEVFSIKDMLSKNRELQRSLDNYDILIKAQLDNANNNIQHRMVVTILITLLQIPIFFSIWYLIEYASEAASVIQKNKDG